MSLLPLLGEQTIFVKVVNDTCGDQADDDAGRQPSYLLP